MFPITAALFSMILGGCSKNSAQTGPSFSELGPQDIARLEAQRAVVASAAKQKYGTLALTKTRKDLPVLQRLIDDKVFTKKQSYELQSLGVAYGDVLASELPLRWVMVTDEYGTDPTLRYKQTTLQVNALTMISKRVEQDQNLNLADLLSVTQERLDALEKKMSK